MKEIPNNKEKIYSPRTRKNNRNKAALKLLSKKI